MYPRLSDLFSDLFGLELPVPIYSFGAMVAVAFLVAAWLGRKELDRLHAEGRLPAVPLPVREKKGSRVRKTLQRVRPGLLVGNLTVIAVFGGFAGAKLFHILENPGDFAADPLGMLFSTGGFTFYGGLIVAAAGVAWYVRKKGLPVWTVADAVAPGLMLAYGIGRLGCHLAGDGDWGIPADLSARPGWLPVWLWAETYPNNILGVDLSGAPVYPTPIYEFVAAALLFAVLWGLRRHPFLGGWLFSLYLVLNGLERFLIEQIRVNVRFDLFGLSVTQAEVLAVVLMAAGGFGLVRTWKRRAEAGVPAAMPQPAAEGG
ncbi:prolipoprotein diacylglyceryl transferase [Rhodocaloribacter litoris]|uniref:prolipoprotein diacylglyceryl transferase n=1 Tax=Rhodocaloribacter litoris TaxID=2558931 RepID=UPI001421DA7C|nr:prolipoprotein diacylglyceryl transferase [Rhodocaloribacter litoris]QXD16098.1 prolipoprotein diacylglyceryl transferase [Rhodocaloribacter litoris]GIV59832.1 MAG: prolipoprotein diacylglyceryl transferase [Rhodothermaceae bacterium]